MGLVAFASADAPAQTKAQDRAKSLSSLQLCLELGRALRRPSKDKAYDGAVVERAVKGFDLPAADLLLIQKRKLRVGMTSCAVLASMGQPDTMNRTVTAAGTTEQLIYEQRRMYLYLRNNILTSWQE